MQRTSLFLTIGLIAIGVAFLLNMFPIFQNGGVGPVHLSNGEVRGMALYYKGKPYTLNFNQQEAMVNYINRSIPVGTPDLKRAVSEPTFEKLVIYRFDGKADVTLKPIAYLKDWNLLYTLHELYPDGYLQDISLGDMHRLLDQIHQD